MTTLYNFTVQQQDGNQQSLATYQGKLVLIVNTATACHFTPQYQALQALYERYQAQGLEILDFPCNQFQQTRQTDAAAINSFCQLHYGTTFPRFAMVKVNGKAASPLYQWLKQEQPGLFGAAIKWNFTKFLIGRDGQVLERFAPTTKPEDLENRIKSLLA